MPRKPNKKNEAEAPFENLMEQIEGLVDRLEEGELSLEESLTHYEKGVALVRQAQTRLDQFDQRLEQLTEEGALEPFAHGSQENPDAE